LIKILHLSPHLGGGVGTVLLSYLSKNKTHPVFQHSIFCLDTINENAKKYLVDENISFKELVSNNIDELLNTIKYYDILVIHWWNHPLLFLLLVRYKLPLSRVIFWSHVSGEFSPNNFTKKLFNYPDYFVFSTPISYFNQKFLEFKDKDKFFDIWSTGGVKNNQKCKKREGSNFIIGYIGTIDYAKVYPKFIELCKKINIPNVKFIICGDGSSLSLMKEQVRELKLTDKFIFTGHVDNVSLYLSQFDIFAYPLSSTHYGTCDQVLAEAMSMGIVPVVFDNRMESYMVHNLYDGFVVKNDSEYVQTIESLYKNKRLRELMGKNSKESANRRFSITTTLDKWDKLYKKILKKSKSIKSWQGTYSGLNTTSFEIFFESVSDFNENIEDLGKNMDDINLAWLSKTKGSPFHYLKFLEYDEKLESLCIKLKNYEGKRV